MTRTPMQHGSEQKRSSSPRKSGSSGMVPLLLIKSRFCKFRRWLGIVSGVAIVFVILMSAFLYLHYRALFSDLPTVAWLKDYQPPVMSRIYASNDNVIAELAEERRLFIPVTAIPDMVKNTFIVAEDNKFYTHGGVDPLAIARAVITDLTIKLGKRPIGASTITQQVARIMLLGSNQVSIVRKVKEALLAMRMEKILDKNRILELYLNEIYMGNGAYGVVAAAQTYFDKPLDQLDIAQAALLAALPKSPSNYNPYRHPQASLARRNWIIWRLADNGYITPQQAETAAAEPLGTRNYIRPGPVLGTEWFSSDVRRQLIDRYGLTDTMEGGLNVHTTLDLKLQTTAVGLMRQAMMNYSRSHEGWLGPVGSLSNFSVPVNTQSLDAVLKNIDVPLGMLRSWRLAIVLSDKGDVIWKEGLGKEAILRKGTILLSDISWSKRKKPLKSGDVVMIEPLAENQQVALRQIPGVRGALVSLDVRTGRVLAMVGGWSFKESQFNRATQALRQPGSSFKPLVYLAAMEKGLSPSQKFNDAPITIGNWSPNNYEMNFWGPTTLHDAIRGSRNLVTVRLAQYIGMKDIARLSVTMGEVDNMPEFLPIALGATETTVLRHAAVYATIAAEGREVMPVLIDDIRDRNGKIIWRAPGFSLQGMAQSASDYPVLKDDRPQIVNSQSVYQLITMMKDVVQQGTGRRAALGITQPIAGKTGTTQDFRDAWFAGFSPDIATVVWFGYDLPKSLGVNQTGAVIAAPVWNAFMKVALSGSSGRDFPIPQGVTLAQYDTGRISATDAFKSGQIPGVSNNLPLSSFGGLTISDTGRETLSPPPVTGKNSPSVTAIPSTSGGDIGMGGLY